METAKQYIKLLHFTSNSASPGQLSFAETNSYKYSIENWNFSNGTWSLLHQH